MRRRRIERELCSYSVFSVVAAELDATRPYCFEFQAYPDAATCYVKAIRSRLFESVTLTGFGFGDLYGEVLREWPRKRHPICK